MIFGLPKIIFENSGLPEFSGRRLLWHFPFSGLLSVALSVGRTLPLCRPGVTRHHALRSPDFPHRSISRGAGTWFIVINTSKNLRVLIKKKTLKKSLENPCSGFSLNKNPKDFYSS
ncbi:hypothetical protein TREPR_2322 [Treponema primitia ZAS-2]|uniref:Uncharacterized protein n=1 Tax=Treponema primitia (strain ATCC BAA-887 / DSM 12427 / ZAS-2) TaxID=545694 RepID=F5YHY3_TREPZ|nr:hypothetical protein TREPR_2322 [Treponema primitia ZAS-2]